MIAIDTAIRAAAAEIELIGVTKSYDAKNVIIPPIDVSLRPASTAADGTLTCRVVYQAIAGHRPAAETRPTGGASGVTTAS